MTGFLLVLFIVLPKYHGIDLTIAPLLLLYLKLCGAKVVELPRTFGWFAIAFGVLLLLALLSSIINGTVAPADITLKPVRQVVIAALLLSIFHAARLDLEYVLRVIWAAAVANAAVIVLQYWLHNSGISSDFLLTEGFSEEVNVPYRKPGVTSGYPIAGMLSVYGLVIALHLLNARRTSPVVGLTSAFILLVGTSLSSRMALLLAIVAIVLYLPTLLRPAGWPVLGLLAGATYLSAHAVGEVVHVDTINVMFELFLNALAGEGATTASSEALLDSYRHFPVSAKTLLIGNASGNKADDGYTVDSSIQILLFSGGIAVAILYNMLLVAYWVVAAVPRNAEQRKVIGVMFLFVFISNIKQNTMFSRVVGDCLVLLAMHGLWAASALQTRERTES